MYSPVTLRRYDGEWQVTRGKQRWTPPVLVRHSRYYDRGWSVTHRGTGVEGFRTHADVRAWCNGPDGRDWLDSLPAGAP
jgi:hypothetical protein